MQSTSVNLYFAAIVFKPRKNYFPFDIAAPLGISQNLK